MWYIYKKKYYPAVKKNEAVKFVGKRTHLENKILSEVTQNQK